MPETQSRCEFKRTSIDVGLGAAGKQPGRLALLSSVAWERKVTAEAQFAEFPPLPPPHLDSFFGFLQLCLIV